MSIENRITDLLELKDVEVTHFESLPHENLILLNCHELNTPVQCVEANLIQFMIIAFRKYLTFRCMTRKRT